MTVVDKVLQKLDQAGVPYKKVGHAPVITSADAAKIRETSLSIGAKALVFIADTKPVMIVVPGDKKVDTKTFKRQFDIKDMRMATGEELLEHTRLPKGAVPPLGSVFGVESYFDNQISKLDKVAFNAGSRSVSVEMTAQDLIKVEQPALGSFSRD